MLLAFVIESVTGQPLDQYLEQNFWAPMGLDHITYNPLLNGFAPNDCAATELNGNTRDGAVHFTGVLHRYPSRARTTTEKAFYAMGRHLRPRRSVLQRCRPGKAGFRDAHRRLRPAEILLPQRHRYLYRPQEGKCSQLGPGLVA